MRIHLHNRPSTSTFPLTRADWDQAAASAPEAAAGHVLSFGDTDAAFDAAIGEAEALVATTSVVRLRFSAHADAPLDVRTAAPRLKLIYCTSAGLESLAPFDWLPPEVVLMNNRGTHGQKAGEYGLMALIMLACRMPALATAQREGRWAQQHGSVLAGKEVVVVGLGALGGSVAAHAKAFGMRVTGVRTEATPHPACDRVVSVAELDSVLPGAHSLVLATPMTPATANLLSRERIALLPPGAGVVNIGRGGLLDQDALCDALDDGRLGGAVLDVFVPEPVPDGHRLWTTRNLIITPHVSADDPHTYNVRSLEIFLGNLGAFQRGSALPNRFDVARGY